MEMEADMDTVLECMDLLLDRDGAEGVRSDGQSGRSAAGKDADSGCATVKQRIERALRMYKEAAEDHDGGVLVQVWAPARDGGRRVLVTQGQVYDIQAALALPVLDPDNGACLAVLELVMTSPRLRFAAEVDRLCKALQVTSQICNDEATELAMSEVSSIVTTVCEALQLPLAQAWVRCKRCNTTGTEHVPMTAAGAPFHLAGVDQGVRGAFREACVEHHLREGRGGLVEEAARFCADVTKYSMDEDPLAHHARFSGLAGCVAVCVELRRDEEGDREECVLEFFLPPDCRDGAAQKGAVEAVAATIRERFGNGDLKAIALCGLQAWLSKFFLNSGWTTMEDA